MSDPEFAPSAKDAIQLAESFFAERAESCVRFTTGLRHWVYDVALADSARRVVVRLSHPDHRRELAGGVFWHDQLAATGVPVAAVIAADVSADQTFMILERLAGTDIGNVLDTMSQDQIRSAAHAVAEMQHLTGALPLADGFGYALNYQSPLHRTWRDVLEASLDKSRQWIRGVGIVDEQWVAQVAALLDHRAGLVDDVEPKAFLHDATTKNVIIDHGSVTGLVDVDEMAFGDPLWTVALSRMSLLSAILATGYADEQIVLISPSSTARDRVELYTALHCLSFLGELGQAFNRDKPSPLDQAHQAHLEGVLSSLM